MIYEYLQEIEKDVSFIYMMVAVGIIYFVTKVFQPRFVHFMAFVGAAIIIYYLNDRRRARVASTNKELEYRMNALVPRPKYFYIDADIINLFYNIREFRVYNKEAYDDALKDVDNLLHIVVDVETGVLKCEYHYDVAKAFMYKALNNLQSIIHVAPFMDARVKAKHIVTDKYQSALNILHLLLKRHLDDILKRCEKQRKLMGYNIYTQLRPDEDGPQPDMTQRPDYSPNYYYF